MTYVDPSIQQQLDSLSPELRQAVLDENQPLNNLQDLIRVLNRLVTEE